MNKVERRAAKRVAIAAKRQEEKNIRARKATDASFINKLLAEQEQLNSEVEYAKTVLFGDRLGKPLGRSINILDYIQHNGHATLFRSIESATERQVRLLYGDKLDDNFSFQPRAVPSRS